MGDAHVPGEVGDALAVLKDVGGHAVALTLEYPATGGARRDAARILAAVLQIVETLVQVGGGISARRVGEDESENAAHVAGLGCRYEGISTTLATGSKMGSAESTAGRNVEGAALVQVVGEEIQGGEPKPGLPPAHTRPRARFTFARRKVGCLERHARLFTAVGEEPKAKCRGRKNNPNVSPFSKS